VILVVIMLECMWDTPERKCYYYQKKHLNKFQCYFKRYRDIRKSYLTINMITYIRSKNTINNINFKIIFISPYSINIRLFEEKNFIIIFIISYILFTFSFSYIFNCLKSKISFLLILFYIVFSFIIFVYINIILASIIFNIHIY
jgi:hypothetical protein